MKKYLKFLSSGFASARPSKGHLHCGAAGLKIVESYRCWAVLSLLTLAGCVTSLKGEARLIGHRFASVVFEDGIDAQEAEIIAQTRLIESGLVRLYDLLHPRAVQDVADLPRHAEFWFISFKEKRSSSIEFVYMVLVHKETGRVPFADDYAQSKRWVLEAALLSFENP
jgi:hypothetical protein